MILALAACTFVLVDEPCTTSTTGTPDDTACEAALLFPDADGDGHGDEAGAEERCAAEGWTALGDDCDDADASVFPGATELCNERNDSCDAAWVADTNVATFTDASGAALDRTAELTGAEGAPVAASFEDGELALCEGTWYVNLALSGDVSVRGIGEVVLDGGGAGPVLTLAAGDHQLADLLVKNGAGGISVDGATSVAISGLTVQDNAGEDGAGMNVAASSGITMSDTKFRGNTATGTGGGLLLRGDAVLERVIVEENTAARGGGLAVADGATVDLYECQVMSNEASGAGGGIAAAPGLGGRVTITDSAVTGNSSGTSGGGVQVEDLAFSCVGSADSDGLGVYANTSGARPYQMSIRGNGTIEAQACDVTGATTEDPGDVSVEGVDGLGIWSYGLDADFECTPLACVDR